MCWVSNRKPFKRVADKDIKVLKILCHDNDGYFSPYRVMPYKIGEVNTSNISVNKSDSYYEINDGLHSYSSECRIAIEAGCDAMFQIFTPKKLRKAIINDTWYCEHGVVLAEAIIPEGSTYYVNSYGEIVSDHLIVVSEICRGDELPEGFFGTFEELMYLCSEVKRQTSIINH